MSDIVDTSPIGIERTERIAGDDALNNKLDTVTSEIRSTQESVTTEVLHRSEGDLVIQRILEGYIQDLLEGKSEDFERYIEFQNSQNLNYADVRNFVGSIRTTLAEEIRNLSSTLLDNLQANDARYNKLVSDVDRYIEILSDITLDSNQITLDNGELRAGAWTILSQARAWDLEIISRLNGLSASVGDSLKDAVEEIQNQLPSTEETISKAIEELSSSPIIKELSDLLNQSITNDISLSQELLEQARKQANEMVQLAADLRAEADSRAKALEDFVDGEVTTRIQEVNKEVAARKEAIYVLSEALAQDVGELNDQVDSIRDGATADKANILETVNNYKTELKSDIATVNTELLGALDGVNTLVTEVRDENGVTLNELTTYKASNDVALAGVLSKVTTNISDTAANASKITGLTTSLATTNTELGTVRNTSANALSKANTAVTANSALATRVDSLAAAITDLGEGAETTVDVYAFNALKAEVGTNAAGVSSLVEQVNALGTNYTNLADGVEANTDAVSTLTVKQSEMNGDISQLSSDVTYLTSELGVTNTALNTKASNQALSNLNTKLTTTDGLVAANTQQLTQLNTDLTTVKNGLETKASTEALNDLATEVIELEDGLAVNASAITSLKSEIDTELNKKATVTAVNGLTTKVEEVEGKTTTNANNLLALNTSVGNVVKGLANKLDASTISDYYTKSQADDKAAEVAAGKVEEFSANLVVGGTNLATTNSSDNNRPTLAVSAGLHYVEFHTGVQIEAGKKYTFTIIVEKLEGYESVPIHIHLGVAYFYGGGYVRDLGFNSNNITSGKRVIITFTPRQDQLVDSEGEVRDWLMFRIRNERVRVDVTFRQLQVEEGSVPTAWSPSPEDVKNAIDANSTAIQNTSAEVSRVDGRVTATNSAQTLLEGRVQTVEGGVAKKADASALSSLDTRVGTVEGQYTTQASDITKLSNSLDTTIVDVGTAQTAAQNAMNAAGSKGKVIFGTTAPAVADRLSQNLWIDTTSNANTPKRWNGSAWVVVTDKVATDAAKAVSDLDTAVKTKADVSALNSLTTKVTDEAKKTVANTNNITELNSDIVKINNNLATKANASALSDMYTKSEVDDKAAEISAGEVSKYDASLVIGGVNLIEKSKFIGGTQNPKDFTVKLFAAPVLNAAAVNSMFTEGETYTVSFEYEVVGKPVPSTPNVNQLGFILYSATNTGDHNNHANNYLWWDATSGIKTVGYKGKITKTFKVVKLHPDHQILAYTNRYSTNGVAPFDFDTVRFTNFQIEKGTKATAWSPSPNDVQNSLDANATAISNTNAEVVKVDGKTITNANNIILLKSDVTEVKNGLSTKANTSALNDYYTRSETDGVATTAAAGELSKYDASLVIGGTNLYKKARGSEWLNQVYGTGYYSVIYFNVLLDRTKKYTVSFEADHLSGGLVRARLALSKGPNQDASTEITAASVDITSGKHSITMDMSKLSITNIFPEGDPVYLMMRMRNERVAANIRIRYIQVEEGSKATTWSPSPEDVQTALDANASALSNMDTEVSRVDDRVTTEANRITSLTGRVDTAEKGIALKADVAALNNIYTKTETDDKATSLAAGEVSKYDARLVIGGSNLLLNSNFAAAPSTDGWSSNGGGFTKVSDTIHGSVLQTNLPGGLIHAWLKLDNGVDYVYSALVKPTNDTVMSGTLPLHYHVGLNNSNQGKINILGFSHTSIPGGVWSRVWIHFKLTGDANSFRPFIYGGAANTIQVAWTQLERGSKATDWKSNSVEVQSLIDANSEALITTNAEVKRIDDEVISHANHILNLNSGIAGKADASALNNIYTMAQTDDKIESVAAGKVEAYKSALVIGGSNQLLNSEAQRDSGAREYFTYERSEHLKQFYDDNLGKDFTVSFEIMVPVAGRVQVYSSNSSAHVYTLTTPWLEANTWTKVALTGRPQKHPTTPNHAVSTLEFFGTYDTGRKPHVRKVQLEKGNVATDWSPSFRDQPDMSGYATASAVQTLTTEVERVDGVAKSAAESAVTLTSRVDDAENKLQVQAKVIDGVKASYMVKMETNGVIGGFGLMQSTGALGQVQTSFGVNANAFFIGAPASKKQPFIVTTTNQVVDGITYPAGTYINSAIIANATIGSAHIADASITNAKIKELDASKITTGTLDAKRIRIGSTTQFDSGFAPTDVLNDAKAYTDAIEVGAANLLYRSYDSSLWLRYGSPTFSLTSDNYVMQDSLLITQTTFEGSGGTNTLKVYRQGSNLEVGRTLTISANVKNRGTKNLTVITMGLSSNRGVIVAPGKTERIIFTGTPTQAYVQFRIETAAAADAFKVDIIDLKYEYGNKATSWTPSPAEVNALIDSKAKTFLTTPTVPYGAGDIWKDGSTTKVSILYRGTGSFTASDWVLVGDVTANNKSADTGKVNGVAAATVVANAANGAAVYSDVMSDLKITPVEKTAINQEWNRIQKEYASLLAQAQALSITTTTYTSAYTGLSTTAPSMSSILSSMSTTTTLTAAQRDAYKTQYTTYYTQAVAITKAINDKIAANAKADLDNLEVGGRNLLLRTSAEKSVNRNFDHYITIPLTLGHFTYSVWLKSASNVTATVYLNDDSGQNRTGMSFGSISLTPEYKYFTFTGMLNKYVGDRTDQIVLRVYASAAVVITGKLAKLEKGNKATDWTPAPEDVDVAIAAKAKTFTAQPVPPYTSGDLWRNGGTIRVCTVSRATGSYVAADWTLVGDVTSANTAADASKLGGKASATVFSDITGAKNAADAAASKASAAENQLALWKYPNTTEIDGGKIRTNSVTANQINVANLSLISGNMGTIKVGTANIADLAVDTLHIKDRAITVPLGIQTVITNAAFSGNVAAGWQRTITIDFPGIEVINPGSFCTLFFRSDLKFSSKAKPQPLRIEISMASVVIGVLHSRALFDGVVSERVYSGIDDWTGSLVIRSVTEGAYVDEQGSIQLAFTMPHGVVSSGAITVKFINAGAARSVETSGTFTNLYLVEFKK